MKHDAKKKAASGISRFIARITGWSIKTYSYVTEGVWSDTRKGFGVDTIRTINLSVKSFFDRDLQVRASSLTFQTLLAIVPALALIFAIGRGFGLQDVITEEIYKALPSQKAALEAAFGYVDSYLQQSSSGGVFLGIGILFLLWTLISLLSSVEDSFNTIWGVKQGRGFFRKVTDYTAIFLILPVLMLCSNGLSILMSTTLHKLLPYEFLSPAISVMLDLASVLMIWVFFTGVYMLIPNCKVRFSNALLAGVIAGTGYLILQWLFITGQLYVAKYNAIYGSVAFLPLFLLWAQLAWVITLSGAVICYSSQNIFQYSFSSQIEHISLDYRQRIIVAVMTVIIKRFNERRRPITPHDFAVDYDMPARLVSDVTSELIDCGLLSKVVVDERREEMGLQPALPPAEITLGRVLRAVNGHGNSDFIPLFAHRFASVNNAAATVNEATLAAADNILLSDLAIPAVHHT